MTQNKWATGFRLLVYVGRDALQIYAALIAIFGASAVGAYFLHLTAYAFLVWPLVSFGLGVFAAAAIFYIGSRSAAKSKSFLYGYLCTSVAYLYEIDEQDPAKHTHRRCLRIKALRSGITHIEARYRWSGHGDEGSIEVVSPGHKLVGQPIARDMWKYYYINLGQELAIGGETEIVTVQRLRDDNGTFEPHLSKEILETIHELTLTVKPGNTAPVKIDLVEENMRADTVVSSREGIFDPNTKEIKWVVKHPMIGHRYRLRWTK
jgi:hypothetical protein